jgi:uncharacterized protein (TIGR02246 family)
MEKNMKKLLLSAFSLTLLSSNVLWAAGTCNTEVVVKAADQLWQTTLATHDPQKVANLYQHDAVLLGTYENVPLLTEEQRVDYFKHLFAKIPDIQVKFDQVHVKLLKEDAISTGLYTFYGTQADGKKVSIPARYTFAYDSTAQGCELVMHHSSVLPVEYQSIDEMDQP